jgi:hypothetical protein
MTVAGSIGSLYSESCGTGFMLKTKFGFGIPMSVELAEIISFWGKHWGSAWKGRR